MKTCRLFVLVFLAVLGTSAAAFGQTATAAQPAAPALPDARGIAATCGTLPPADRPLPSLTGAARLEYQRTVLSAVSDFNAGRFASALQWQWVAYVAYPAPEAANQLVVYLTAAGAAAESHRCAIVACLAPRATGAQRAELEAERNRCAASTPLVSVQPVETFSLTGEALLAVRANPPLDAEIRRDPITLNVTMAGHPDELRVSVTYRARVNAALEAYRRTHPAVVTPNPRPGRSTVGYAVPAVFAATSVIALGGAITGTVVWSNANGTLDASNRGQTNVGWDREAEARARNAALAQEILYPVAIATAAGAVVTWFVLAPRQATPTTAPARPRAALIPSFAPDHVGAVLAGSF